MFISSVGLNISPFFNSGANQISFATGGSERLRIDSAGQIESVSLGTAAAPAFSFTTDPNTGFYSPGADQLAISTKIASELFDLMQNAYDAIGWMRWGNKYQRITVNKPAEFTIRNAESLTSEFKTAMDAKLPSPYLNKVLSENLRVRFSADEQLMKAMEVVSLIDPFVSIDDQTLNLKKSNGLIALWEAVLHDRIYTFIEDELRKDNNFLDKDIEVIKTTLQELAKQKATELTPVRGTAEDILNRI